jgi:hypothetical protein
VGPAAALSAQLRRAARTLDHSVPRLNAAAHHAKQDWNGAYARRFDDHMSSPGEARVSLWCWAMTCAR